MTSPVREAGWAVTDAQEIARARVVRAVRPRRDRRRFQSAIVCAFTSVMALGLMFWVDAGVEFGFFALFTSLLFLCLGVVTVADRQTPIGREALEGFEITLGERGRHVSVGIWQGDALTGEDEGLLWFEDGRLYFSGRRTSFGLVPAQVRGRSRMHRGWTEDQIELALLRDTVAGPMRLSLRLLPSSLNADFAHRAALRTELDAWAEEPVLDEGQFPPASLGPGLPRERRLLTEALLLTLPPAVMVALVVGALVPGGGITGLLLGVSVFAGMVPVGNLRWRAMRDRRRVRRGR